MFVPLFILFLSFLLGLVFLGPAVRFVERVPQALLFFVVLFAVYRDALPFAEAVSVGSLNVSPMDLASVAMILFSLPFFINRLRRGFVRRDLVLLGFIAWAALLFANFVLGAKEFGLQPATNEFRPYLFFIAVGVFVATRDVWELWPRIEQVFLVGGSLLLLVALVGYADGDFSREGRPLPSHHALFLLQAAWIGLFLYERGRLSRYMIPVCVLFLAMVVFLQHRTVWVVLIVSLVLVARYLERSRPLFLKLVVSGTVVVGCVGFVLFGDTLFRALEASYSEATSTGEGGGKSTFLWRVESWKGLLGGDQMDSLQEVLAGNPFGAGWEREVTAAGGATIVVDVSPHNYYLRTLLRSGAVGLLLFVWIYFQLVRKLLRGAVVVPGYRSVLRCLAVLLVCQLIYYIPYSAEPVQAILLGAAMGLTRKPPENAEVMKAG